MTLHLIYHFQASHNLMGDFQPASYAVVYFFSAEGMLEENLLKEMAKTVPDANHERLTFLNLDDLKSFTLRVCQELSASEVRLLSVQDYNIGLDGARDLISYKTIFEKYGDLVINNDNQSKKGFFKKFFS